MPLALRSITASGEGFVTSSGTRFDALREALDAELAVIATTEKPLYFRDADTGDLNGEMRWLPACDVEGAPVRGIRIDATAIEEMAASLNANPRALPINGGPTPAGLLPSSPHGDVVDSSTLANGRAQWGVVVTSDATTKLYLYAEVMPHIARELDVGRLAEGSVCFDWQTTEAIDGADVPRGVSLISHAFTNDPAVLTLEPANSVRTGRRSHSLTGAMRSARARKDHDMKPTIRTHLAAMPLVAALAVARRGPALDKLAEIAKLVGVSLEDEMTAEGWDSPTSNAISTLKSAATVEKMLEASPPAAPVEGMTARADAPVVPASEPAAARADVAGLPDEAAKDKFVTDVIAALVAAGIAKEGDDASTALAAVQAHLAAMPLVDAPAEGAPPAMGAERSRDVAIAALRDRAVALEREVAELRPLAVEKRARDHASAIDAEIKRLGLERLPAAMRSRFYALDRAGAFAALAAAHLPPIGDVMPAPGEASRTGGELTQKAAIDAEVGAAKAYLEKHRQPVNSMTVRSRAIRLATDKHPHLFEADGASAGPTV